MASIFVRNKKGGKKSYRAKVTDSFGKEIYKTFEKRRDAETWLAQQKIKKTTEGLVKGEKKAKFEEYAQWWLNERKTVVAPRTSENYESNLRLYIGPKFNHMRLDRITYQHAIDFQKFLTSKGLENKTNNHIVTIFKQILIYATKGQGYRKQLNTNPVAGIEMLPEKRPPIKFWDSKEVRFFLSAAKQANDFYYEMYVVDINTGMRLGEIAGLQKKKVDFESGTITISQALKRIANRYKLDKTKTGDTRIISMNKTVRDILSRRCRGLKDDDYIFTQADRSNIDLAHFSFNIFGKTQKKYKVKKILRFHDLRHTFASNFMMNGGALYSLQKLLGHVDHETTMQYAHLSPTYMKNEANVVEFSGEQDD